MMLRPGVDTPPQDKQGRIILRMQADYGLCWPLSDACWPEAWGSVDWPALIGKDLVERLSDWCRDFTLYANYETGDFNPPGSLREFNETGERLAAELRQRVGDRFRIDYIPEPLPKTWS